MLAFLADENFHGAIVRGLRLRQPEIDLVSVQEVGLRGREDPEVLEWAAQHHRILLTHDIQTIPRFAFERIEAGLPMPGGVEVDRYLSFSLVIEDILTIAECSLEGELEGRVLYLPL